MIQQMLKENASEIQLKHSPVQAAGTKLHTIFCACSARPLQPINVCKPLCNTQLTAFSEMMLSIETNTYTEITRCIHPSDFNIRK